MPKTKAHVDVTSTSDARRAQMRAAEIESGPLQAAVYEARRANIRALKEARGADVIAHTLGMRQSSFLSQVAGINPSISISESKAREWERKLGLEAGSLDKPFFGKASRPVVGRVAPPVQQTAAPELYNSKGELDDLTRHIIREVADLTDTGYLLLDNEKIAKMQMMVVDHASSHGGRPSVSFIADILKLMKT